MGRATAVYRAGLPGLIPTTFYNLLMVVNKLRCYDSVGRGYLKEHAKQTEA